MKTNFERFRFKSTFQSFLPSRKRDLLTYSHSRKAPPKIKMQESKRFSIAFATKANPQCIQLCLGGKSFAIGSGRCQSLSDSAASRKVLALIVIALDCGRNLETNLFGAGKLFRNDAKKGNLVFDDRAQAPKMHWTLQKAALRLEKP